MTKFLAAKENDDFIFEGSLAKSQDSRHFVLLPRSRAQILERVHWQYSVWDPRTIKLVCPNSSTESVIVAEKSQVRRAR